MPFQPVKTHADNVLRFPLRAPAVAERLRPVMIMLHQETSTPGRVGNVLRMLGHGLDIRRRRFGDSLPETLDGHAGAVRAAPVAGDLPGRADARDASRRPGGAASARPRAGRVLP